MELLKSWDIVRVIALSSDAVTCGRLCLCKKTFYSNFLIDELLWEHLCKDFFEIFKRNATWKETFYQGIKVYENIKNKYFFPETIASVFGRPSASYFKTVVDKNKKSLWTFWWDSYYSSYGPSDSYAGGCIYNLNERISNPPNLVSLMPKIKQYSTICGDKLWDLKPGKGSKLIYYNLNIAERDFSYNTFDHDGITQLEGLERDGNNDYSHLLYILSKSSIIVIDTNELCKINEISTKLKIGMLKSYYPYIVISDNNVEINVMNSLNNQIVLSQSAKNCGILCINHRWIVYYDNNSYNVYHVGSWKFHRKIQIESKPQNAEIDTYKLISIDNNKHEIRFYNIYTGYLISTIDFGLPVGDIYWVDHNELITISNKMIRRVNFNIPSFPPFYVTLYQSSQDQRSIKAGDYRDLITIALSSLRCDLISLTSFHVYSSDTDRIFCFYDTVRSSTVTKELLSKIIRQPGLPKLPTYNAIQPNSKTKKEKVTTGLVFYREIKKDGEWQPADFTPNMIRSYNLIII